MNRWLRNYGRVLCVQAISIALALTGTACEQNTNSTADGGVANDGNAGEVATYVAPAGECPKVTIIAPLANKSYTYPGPPGVTFNVTISPPIDCTLGDGAGDCHAIYYLNGVMVEESVAMTAAFNDVDIGRHHVAVQLVDAQDQAPFAGCTDSVDDLYVKVVATCGKPEDCEDNNECSNQNCIANSCNYGPVPDCCLSDLECGGGLGYCSTSQVCVDCLQDNHCDDGNDCTEDFCDPAGNCIHDPIANCCFEDGDCGDADFCTIDSCVGATEGSSGTCSHVSNEDPLCCNVDNDCLPEDPCTAYLCYHNTQNKTPQSPDGTKSCRYGPAEPNCCVDAGECDDGNPCTENLCDFGAGNGESGVCAYVQPPPNPDTGVPSCCQINADCDDSDPSTVDECIESNCANDVDPLYCDHETDNQSVIVIHEIMAAPGDLEDVFGEWFELHVLGEEMIDLTGWTVEVDTSTGTASHTFVKENAVGGSSGLQVFPGQQWVAAAFLDKTVNGGFSPNYQYENLSFPDPFETGGATSFTIRLLDAAGALVDEVTLNSTVFEFQDGRTASLKNPFMDNADQGNWANAGTNKDPSKNLKYGESSWGLYGTPKNENSDIAEGTPNLYCTSLVGTEFAQGICLTGACSAGNKCIFPNKPGCCEVDLDCDDYDVCTADTCDVANNICNPAVVNPNCCEFHDECDDQNPCNFDKCLGAECRYSDNIIPNCCVQDDDCDDSNSCTIDSCNVLTHQCNAPEPVQLGPGEVCCNVDADCDDGDPANLDICDANQSPKICIHPVNPEYCENVDDPCDDGTECTDDFCDVTTKTCQHGLIPGCCQKNADCPSDDNPCTAEICDAATGNCSSTDIIGCCIADDVCNDNNDCTDDLCGSGNVCHNNAIEGCCANSSDCNDSAACTQDSCVNGACEYTQLDSCCTPGGSQQTLVNECGADPDGTANCFVWECTAQGQCNLLQNDVCCSTHPDCDDGDPCTTDACTSSNTCKHIPTSGGQCCVFNSDCPESDGDACTSPTCTGGICSESAIPGCASSVPVSLGVAVDMPSDGLMPNETTGDGTCWSTNFDGILGPDAHARCKGTQGTVEPLQTRSFTYDNADDGSVQLSVGWNNGPGSHSLNVFVTAVQGDTSGAEQLFSVPMGGANPGTQLNAEISNAMLAQNQLWLIFEIVTDAPASVDVRIDDIVAAEGTAPFYVKELSTGKTYDRDTDILLDGGTLNAQLGELKQKVLWVHDAEWETQIIDFTLLDAPSFITVADTAKMNLFGVWQVKIQVAATKASDVGVYDIRVRASDGAFTHVVPLEVNVTLGAGYVLWTPLGVTANDGDAIATALESLGHSYQRVINLAEVADWGQVKGVIAAVGAGSSQANLTSSKVALAIDHLDGGGRLGLFGSWASANQNSMYQRCHAALVEENHGVFGTIEGTLVHPDQTWTYTNDAEYFNDVDQLGPQGGFAARVTAIAQQDGAGLAVIYDDDSTGARHYCSALNFAHVAPGGSLPIAMVEDMIAYFETGAPACSNHGHCADGDACTIDQCIGNICQNTIDEFCDKCQSDLDCTSPEVCKANGDCATPPGEIIAKLDQEVEFNCTTSDEFVQVDITNIVADFQSILNVNVKIGIDLDINEKMGNIRMYLGHGGVQVTVKDEDLTDNNTQYYRTIDMGQLPVEGSMNDFNGTLTNGTWTLTIEDLTGGQSCGVLKGLEVWGEYEPLPPCTVDADCDDGQLCNGAEFCGASGCESGAAPACSDGNLCTEDLCDPLANGAAGACDNSVRVESCAGAPCMGNHSYDPNDGACGYKDACVGAADGESSGAGTCELVCEGCLFHNAGTVNTTVQPFQCITQTFPLETDEPFAETANVQIEVDGDISQIRTRLLAPSNASVDVTWDGAPQVNGSHYTATASFEKILGEMCSIAGVDPDPDDSPMVPGLWKLQVCNDNPDADATLISAQVWVSTSSFDPNEGQECSNAIEIVPNGLTQTFTFDTTCKGNSTSGSCSGANGRDIVYGFTTDASSPKWRVRAEVDFPTHNGAVYLTDSCALGSMACADSGGVGATELVDTQVSPGSFFIVIDSFLDSDKGAGTLNLKITEPKANGQACEDNLDCLSGHCQNGYCCDGGDCCPINGAGECPASYTIAPSCDDSGQCEGHRVDATCTNFQCGSATIGDDSDCLASTESDTCGLYLSVFCNGAVVQQDPPCATTCDADGDCDPGAHCFEDVSDCRINLDNGLSCGRDGHCDSGLCVDGVCCESACDGLCEQCDRPDALGQCTFRQINTDPQDECDGTGICGGVCDGAGACSFAEDTTACDTCLRCDGLGFCTNSIPANQDLDNSCSLCEVCDGANACVNVAAGFDPLSECTDDGASGCGQNGSCDGVGACQLYATGTVCVDQTCTAGYEDPNHECDGVGNCVDPDDVFCEGHICEGANCQDPCANDGGCITGYFCLAPGAAGSCEPKKAQGDLCDADNECQSNFCTDGVCCNVACAGPCRACDVSGTGMCTNHEFYTDPENGCGLISCDGEGACKTTCFDDECCKSNAFCNGTTCELKRANGDTCSADNQCTSEICSDADGVCCDAECGATCESCKLAASLGTCTLVGDGADPDDECLGTHATCGGTCDGAGSCGYPSSTLACGTCQRCDGAGQCTAVAQNSDPDNSCGLCQTCSGSTSCMNVPVNADFHNDCAATDVSTCGLNGQCDGNAACDFHGVGSVAQAGSCNASGVPHVESLADSCDGSGGISDGGTKNCTPYVCGDGAGSSDCCSTHGYTGCQDPGCEAAVCGPDPFCCDDQWDSLCSYAANDVCGVCTGGGGVSCLSSCTTDAQCEATFFCDVNDSDNDGRVDDCEKSKADGAACSNDLECANGTCSNGFCCSGGTCCSSNADCQFLASDAVCDGVGAGGCVGSRVDAVCDGNKQCQTSTVSDPSACASQECQAANCQGLTYVNERLCAVDGTCSLGGTTFSCDDGNICTDDFCDAGTQCSHQESEGEGVACYNGPAGTKDVGQCKGGTGTCVGGESGSCAGEVVPAAEGCDGLDNDCDGVIDEEGASGCSVFFEDVDGDGVGTNNFKCLCAGSGNFTATANGDCNDDPAAGGADAKPGNVEVCDGVDNNCNSLVDEDGSSGCSNYYLDGDSDGYGVGNAVCKCAAQDPYDATQSGDCNDGNNTISPGQAEVCDGYDNNCNGVVDLAEININQACPYTVGDPHATAGCGGNGCYNKACSVNWFDVDGVFGNGCEAGVDAHDQAANGDFCSMQSHGSINLDSNLMDNIAETQVGTATTVPAGDVDWWRFYPTDQGIEYSSGNNNNRAGADFHIDIRFAAAPGDGQTVFDVYKNGCSSKVCGPSTFYTIRSDLNTASGYQWGNQNCNEQASGGGQCSNGANNCCGQSGSNCCHYNSVGRNVWYHVKVYRKNSTAHGTQYKLQVSNGNY